MMGLVDYSDSESSDSETKTTTQSLPPAKPAALPIKQGFQKVVDKSNPGKIRVNLPAAQHTKDEDHRPAKRPRTGGAGLFSGLTSFLPAPKRSGDIPMGNTSENGSMRLGAGRGLGSGVNLKTGATPAFSRAEVSSMEPASQSTWESASSVIVQPEEPEVKLVGKATVFKPLSVSRKSQKKRKPLVAPSSLPSSTTSQNPTGGIKTQTPKDAAPSKPKVSLFSLSQPDDGKSADLEEYEDLSLSAENGAAPSLAQDHDHGAENHYAMTNPTVDTTQGLPTLNSIASDLNLDEAARRQLFGRRGKSGNLPVNLVNFDTDREYAANEEIRASGESILHNPLKGIQPGKHSLKQLVNAASAQKDALEDAWAAGRRNKKEAGNKYGW
jgi:hypothetical protein